jgi:hypothetical protein
VAGSRLSRRAAAADPAAAALQVRFAAARYDWDDPLSARSYRDWRNGLGTKQDEVETLADSFRIRTTTSEGDLATASLTLRALDLAPVEARLEFRDREWVELTEVSEASIGDDAPPAVAGVEPPSRRAEPSQPTAASPASSATISEELQVLAALHEIGADLGDPVEVARSEGRVRVTGIGVSTERQAEINSKLQNIPNVKVEFSIPTPATLSGGAAAPATAPPGNASGFHARIVQQLGSRAEFERFSTRLLDQNEAAMARVYALRSLAQRFTATEEARLSGADREVLVGLVRDHLAGLKREAAGVERAIQPLLAAVGASPGTRPTPRCPDWQTCAEELFRGFRRAEVLLSAILGVSQLDVPADRLASDLLAALGDIRAALESSDSLFGR